MGLTEKLQETRRKSERLGEKEHKRKENKGDEKLKTEKFDLDSL